MMLSQRIFFTINRLWMLSRTLFRSFDQRVLGAVFLILATALGGGILALPLAGGPAGFMVSSGALLLAWFVMTYCAFVILEINLCFPSGSNLLTMARETLGKPGQVITGFSYLFLFYMLLSAYISGGSELIVVLLKTSMGLSIPSSVASALFVVIFGAIVFSKMHRLDYVNRMFILVKFVLYLTLIGLVNAKIDYSHLWLSRPQFSSSMMMVFITSFGFAVILPSLRVYLKDDVTKLRLALFVGSIIPLFIYLLWNYVIMGSLGAETLSQLTHSRTATVNMIEHLQLILENNQLSSLFYTFASICLITSFFGITLSLSDFLADGLSLKKQSYQSVILFILTLAPPLIMVTAFAQGFVSALSYAGIFCLIVHVVLPLLMAWSIIRSGNYKILFPKSVSFLVMIFSIVMLSMEFVAIVGK